MAKTSLVQASVVDAIFAKVEPIEAAAVVLGGTAAACGIVPPFTRMLMSMGDVKAEDMMKLIPIAIPGGLIGLTISQILSQPDEPEQPSQKEAWKATTGLFCAGGLEALIVLRAASNPAFMTAAGNVAAASIEALGKMIPTGGGGVPIPI